MAENDSPQALICSTPLSSVEKLLYVVGTLAIISAGIYIPHKINQAAKANRAHTLALSEQIKNLSANPLEILTGLEFKDYSGLNTNDLASTYGIEFGEVFNSPREASVTVRPRVLGESFTFNVDQKRLENCLTYLSNRTIKKVSEDTK